MFFLFFPLDVDEDGSWLVSEKDKEVSASYWVLTHLPL